MHPKMWSRTLGEVGHKVTTYKKHKVNVISYVVFYVDINPGQVITISTYFKNNLQKWL